MEDCLKLPPQLPYERKVQTEETRTRAGVAWDRAEGNLLGFYRIAPRSKLGR